MRIVTRPDFDGIVCAVLIREAENEDVPVKWVSPSDMQKRRVEIHSGDIVANLPYHENCSLWFDHHYSNRVRHDVKGCFEIAPSAAGLVFKYYRDRIEKDFSTLIEETDKIDSANLSLEEIISPEKFPYVLLAMTIQEHVTADAPYWNRLTDLMRDNDIKNILRDSEVRKRCEIVVEENNSYRKLLETHTKILDHVAISDFRDLDSMPYGNRFLPYSMFPEATVSVKIGFEDPSKEIVVVKVGHSIINRNCQVNVGQMLSYFEGGGHKGAGSCKFHVDKSKSYLPKIIDILRNDEPEGSIVVKVQRRSQDRRSADDRRKAPRGSAPSQGLPDRRHKERRHRKEPRKDWKRTNTWKSIKITL